MASAHGSKSTVNPQKSAIAMMAAIGTVGAAVIGVTPTQLNSLPTRVAVPVPVQLTAAQSALEAAAVGMVKNLLAVGSTGTSAAALKPAVAVDALTSAAAISPTSIIQQIIDGVGLFLFGPGSTSLIGLTTQVGYVANSALIGVDGAVYQASNALASAVAGAASGLLAPAAGIPPVKAVIAAVSTLLQNLVPPPNGLLSASGGFGFQLPEIPLNLLTIAGSPIKAIGLAVQAFFANLQGASVAAVKNSVAAIPKATMLALAPTSATGRTETAAETPTSGDATSDKTTASGDTKPGKRSKPSHVKADPTTTSDPVTTPDAHTKSGPATKSDKAGTSDSESSKSDGAKASHRGSGPRHAASGNAHRTAGAHSGGTHAGK